MSLDGEMAERLKDLDKKYFYVGYGGLRDLASLTLEVVLRKPWPSLLFRVLNEPFVEGSNMS